MKKILFNDRFGLTEAVLTGRKTMTRRIIKVPIEELNAINRALRDEVNINANMRAIIKKYATYQVGEEVAIAQSYSTLIEQGYFRNEHGLVPVELCEGDASRNKMFVRAAFMPHRIRFTDVKVERLQDISDEDCLKEGIIQSCDGMDMYTFDGWFKRHKGGILPTSVYSNSPHKAFAALIDRISGKGTWERNPYVFVYTFELVR